jgi:hypothetical protein
VLAGAEQGIGLALTRWSLAAQDLAAGRIVRASERTVPCPRAYYFVCPEMYVRCQRCSNCSPGCARWQRPSPGRTPWMLRLHSRQPQRRNRP